MLHADNEFRPRITLLEGAVRSGKTFVNNILWMKHVESFRGQNKKFIVTGNTLASVKRNVLDDLSGTFGVDTALNVHNQFELFGNTVVCFGAGLSDSYRALKGFTAYGWYGNELTEHHENAVRQALLRCSGKGARIFWDTNPSVPDHFVKTQYVDRSGETFADGRTAVLSHHFVLEDNPCLDPDYVADLKKSLPPGSAWYRRDVLGLWVSTEHAIYDHYRIAENTVGDPAHEFEEVIGGVDFGRGGQSPYAMVLIGRSGERFTVFDEVYRASCLNAEFITLAQDHLTNRFPDLKEEIALYGDGADPDKVREWQDAGWRMSPADKRPASVLAGIETVMSVELVITPDCTRTIREIQNYEWYSDASGKVYETPLKYRDHCMDAMRYAVHTHRQKFRGGRNGKDTPPGAGILYGRKKV